MKLSIVKVRKVKMNDFVAGQGVLEKHSHSYGLRKQRSNAGKETFFNSQFQL